MDTYLANLTSEMINQDTLNIDECTTEEILTLINKEDHKVPGVVKQEIPSIAKAVDCIYHALKNGGRLIYLGAGTSGRLGVLDASECPPTYNTRPEMVQGYIAGGEEALRTAVEGSEDNAQLGIDQIMECQITPKDVVVGISASGSAEYVIGALTKANEIGAKTIGVVTNKNSKFEAITDICIAAETGPEVIAGSTRMKSGTAQKLILNMLTTATMIKLGKVYGNKMIDLKASNKKLIERATRIICMVTGIEEDRAKEYLERADNSTKIAIMMILSGYNVEEAKEALDACDGILKKALKGL